MILVFYGWWHPRTVEILRSVPSVRSLICDVLESETGKGCSIG